MVETMKGSGTRKAWLGSVLIGLGILSIIYAAFSMGIGYLNEPDEQLLGPRRIALLIGGAIVLATGGILRTRYGPRR